MTPPKLPSPTPPGDAAHPPAQPPPPPPPTAPAGRSSGGGNAPLTPMVTPSGNSATASFAGSQPVQASSPPIASKMSDGSAAGHALAAGAEPLHGAGQSGAGGSQVKYTKRSSDSGGGAGAGAFATPPAPKGSSSSGAASQQLQAQSGHGSAGHGSAGRGRLQQLGQRLNFVGLGRKKQTSFVPGLSGGGGGGGGGGTVSCPEDASLASGLAGLAPATVSVVSLAPPMASIGGSAPAPAPPSMTMGGTNASATAAAGGGSGSGGNGNGGGTAGSTKAEEFNPPNHPVNPFSYLATPFRVMAKTKAGVAMGRYATTALRLKRDGVPPASYMWLWLGNFKRWHRRYFVASEAPGVLLIYKRANMKGKVWSTSLCDATVSQDDTNPRQIRLATPSGTIFLRVLRPEERQPWIVCLRDSVATYRKHKEVVDTLTAAAGEGGEAAGTVAGALPSVASVAVEQDADQRRRIRTRLNDRLAELAPLVSEVERHLGHVGTMLTGATSGIGHLSGPLLPHNSSMAQLSTRNTRPPPNDHAGHSAPTAASSPAAGSQMPAADGAAGSTPGSGRQSNTGRRAEHAAAAAAAAAGDPDAPHDRHAALSRNRSRSRGVPLPPAAQAAHLVGALTALVEAMRATLHNDAVRIATLEAENAALNKTLNILRANTHRNAARARGMSTPGHTAASAARLAAAIASGVAPDDAASEAGSACTADEDAFDVVEAFDDGVDYSILDDDAPHLHHRLGVDDDEAPYVQHGNYPGAGDEEEEDDEDAEEDAAELAQQAEVLNALEVVRQVEYIAANDTKQLKMLTDDSPPPPDAEEDEGRKGKRKSRGKGEDTDATLDDDDDDDSEAANSSGGTGGESGVARRPYEGRSRLPAPKPLGRGFSIWSILKNMIGRDLTKITMPATINEPLSMTQRMAEVLENRCLLERAATTPNSVDRLMLVSCWLLAGYNSQPLRDNKPFNPLLGETFEWQAADGNARYLCEQVSHHPPVSCFQAEGGGPQGYELYGEVETKTKFWGKTIDCILAGHISLRLKAFDEEYRFNLGTLVINDIILGRFWIDLSCDMKIRNQQTGDTARLVIKPCRGFLHLKERGKCDGVVCDTDGKEVWRIGGSSMGSLHASLTPDAAASRGDGATTEPQLIWSKEPELPNPTEQYCMTKFALGLNDPADPIVPHLPPTDARFRPDMRALELGEWNRATSEKLRLEEKQRTVRRLRKEAGHEYQSRWFRQVLFNTKEMTQAATLPGGVWEYTNEYWNAREQKQWGEMPDLY